MMVLASQLVCEKNRKYGMLSLIMVQNYESCAICYFRFNFQEWRIWWPKAKRATGSNLVVWARHRGNFIFMMLLLANQTRHHLLPINFFSTTAEPTISAMAKEIDSRKLRPQARVTIIESFRSWIVVTLPSWVTNNRRQNGELPRQYARVVGTYIFCTPCNYNAQEVYWSVPKVIKTVIWLKSPDVYILSLPLCSAFM